MDFFSQLRRAAITIQRDAADIHESVEKCRRNSNENNAAAVLVLQVMQNELKNVQKDVSEEMKMLKDDGSFMTAVNLASKLYDKQQSSFQETQSYLKQYGYEPEPDDDAYDNQKGINNFSQNELKTTLGTNTSSENDDVDGLDSKLKRPTTPQPTIARDRDPDKTPKLEDFGLTDAVFEKYKSWKTNVGNSCSTASNNTGNLKIDNRSDNGSEDTNIPDTFCHRGLCVTPGIMGGRSIPCVTPLNAMGNMNSPIAPVFATPGIKPIAKWDNMKINDPKMSELKDEESPVPPEMMTPGLPQIKKLQHQDEMYAHKLNTGNGNSSNSLPSASCPLPTDKKNVPLPPRLTYDVNADDSTPEPPQLTTRIEDLQRISSSKMYSTSMSGIENGSFSCEDPSSGISNVPERIKKSESGTPLAPILTNTFRSSHLSNASTKLQSSTFDVVDNDMPAPPDLTYNYAELLHNVKTQGLPDKPVNTILMSTENLPKTDGDNTMHTTQSYGLKSRLSPLEEEEYQNLPDYVKRQITKSMFDHAVESINHAVKSTKDEVFHASSVREEFGINTNIILLALQKLSRLKHMQTLDNDKVFQIVG